MRTALPAPAPGSVRRTLSLEVAPELLQDACNGPALAAAVARRLDDETLRRAQVRAQYAALDKMGRDGPDPDDAAAEAVLQLLAERAAPDPT